MPKIAESYSIKLRKIVKKYGDNIFSTDNIILYCKLCGIKVNHTKKYFIEQHLRTKKHSNAQKFIITPKIEPNSTYAAENSESDEYCTDLTKMLIASEIPLYKINHPEFKKFMEKYSDRKVPTEATLKRYYIENEHQSVLQKIRSKIGENNIYVSIDETTDNAGRLICNVIVGALHKNTRAYLLTVQVLEKVNASTIATLFDNAMSILWPSGIKRERVLVFVTKAASYMKKCATGLSLLYTKMVHVTCVAHGLHRVCEELRSEYSAVDAFISNIKNVFLESPSRLSVFKEMQPNLPLPLKPVSTHWGTWLSTAVYYAKYYDEIKNIIEHLDEDTASICFVKQMLMHDRLSEQLTYLLNNFSFLVEPNGGIFAKLQQRDKPIGEIVSVVDIVKNNLEQIQEPTLQIIMEKFNNIFSANKGFQQLKEIANRVAGSNSVLPEGIEVKDVESFNWAPLVSWEVEESFSCFKSFFSDSKMSFLPDNLKKYLVPLCFYNNR